MRSPRIGLSARLAHQVMAGAMLRERSSARVSLESVHCYGLLDANDAGDT